MNDIDRLAKMLGMMGSQHDGEALNAARAADKLRRRMHKSWGDLLAGGYHAPSLAERLKWRIGELLHDLTYDGVVWWRNAAAYALILSPFSLLFVGLIYSFGATRGIGLVVAMTVIGLLSSVR